MGLFIHGGDASRNASPLMIPLPIGNLLCKGIILQKEMDCLNFLKFYVYLYVHSVVVIVHEDKFMYFKHVRME